jgi:hypothetical protein
MPQLEDQSVTPDTSMQGRCHPSSRERRLQSLLHRPFFCRANVPFPSSNPPRRVGRPVARDPCSWAERTTALRQRCEAGCERRGVCTPRLSMNNKVGPAFLWGSDAAHSQKASPHSAIVSAVVHALALNCTNTFLFQAARSCSEIRLPVPLKIIPRIGCGRGSTGEPARRRARVIVAKRLSAEPFSAIPMQTSPARP